MRTLGPLSKGVCMREADLALYLGQVVWEHLKEPDIALAWMLPELLLRLSILRNVF